MTTTFMDTLAKWTETNTAMMTNMSKTTQKCFETSWSAGQTWSDGVSVATKRSQKAWTDMMEKSAAQTQALTSTTDASKALASTLDFAVSTCCDAIETGAEVSQLLNKSGTEAQKELTSTLLSSLESLKKDGAKVVKSSDMSGAWSPTTMTAWWSTPEASKWMTAAAWWTPAKTTGTATASATTKTSSGETAASTGAMIASKASSSTATSKTTTSK